MSAHVTFNFTFAGDPTDRDPAAFGQWCATAMQSYQAAMANGAQPTAALPPGSPLPPEAVADASPARQVIKGLEPDLLAHLEEPAVDVINRWQGYDRGHAQQRLDLIAGMLRIPYDLVVPRERDGSPSKRAVLNITPNMTESVDEHAGNFNSGRITFTNARDFVDRNSPLVDGSKTYPTVDLFQKGSHELVIDVLQRYWRDCADRWAGLPPQ